MNNQKIKPSFQISKLEGEKFSSLSDTESGKARIAAAAKDIVLTKRLQEGYSTDYDKWNKTSKHVPLVVAHYERNSKLESGRTDEHFAEVFKVLHAETADVVLVVDSVTGVLTQYPKAYIAKAYEVITLGKFRKGAPEVEALIAETVESTTTT